jgi:hypothetical protein
MCLLVSIIVHILFTCIEIACFTLAIESLTYGFSKSSNKEKMLGISLCCITSIIGGIFAVVNMLF